jgi:acyl-coenzyme A thioesterase PaaI-like protein
VLPDANRCFVCGPDNPVGLRLQFHIDSGDVCRSEFTPGPDHGGYDQLTHGGIVYSALDDVMANWMFLKGVRAHTARCEIRYRQPLAVGTRVLLEGRLVRRKGKVAFLEGRMVKADDGSLVAEAAASFMVIG